MYPYGYHNMYFMNGPFDGGGFAGLASFFGIGLGLFMMLFVLTIVWSIVLKGFALWYSGRAGQKWWFIVLLVVNTFGILDIIYLLFIRPKNTEGSSVTPSQSTSSHVDTSAAAADATLPVAESSPAE